MKLLLPFLLFLLLTVPVLAQKQKVIFDCDLGDDIDDAFALGLLLASQDRFEVLGITTCYGRTNDRATMACKFLYELGLDRIPVAVGRNTSATSTRANWFADQFHWSKGFQNLKPIAQPAADFIVQQLRNYPNEVIVFSVGPVQNMQDVIQKDPGALKLAKSVVAMFGSFYIGYNGSPTPDAEWNVVADATAAQAFVNSGANITYAGLDVTAFVRADHAFRDKLLRRQSPLTNALVGLHTLWNAERDPVLFDAVAVGMVLWPELFKTAPAHVQVDAKGFTRLDAASPPNAQLGVRVQTDDLLKRIMTVYLQQNLGR